MAAIHPAPEEKSNAVVRLGEPVPIEIITLPSDRHVGPRKSLVNVGSSYGAHVDVVSSDLFQTPSYKKTLSKVNLGNETILNGISDEAYEHIIEEKEMRKKQRQTSKGMHARAAGLAIGEELDYVEREQQKLKVNIWLDEEDRGEHDHEIEDVDCFKDGEEDLVPVKRINWKRDGWVAAFAAAVSLTALITVCAWDPRLERHDIHHVKMLKYQAHLASPLYAVSQAHPLVIPMDPDQPIVVLDLKMIIPCAGYCSGGGSHRRVQGSEEADSDHAVAVPHEGVAVRWELFADDRSLSHGSVVVNGEYEAEAYEILDPEDLGLTDGEVLTVALTTESTRSLGIFCEVKQLGILGKYRVPLSAVLFILAFGLILSEVINRCYATFIGAMAGLFLVSITYGIPSVAAVMGMIDFGTLMLLCTMMMCVHIFAVTGFFQWVAVRLAAFAQGDATVLFFLMANAMGLMSCILPNVTCVMLIGPITISLCKQMKLDPVPFYLAQTICSTIGGTTTMIGDPPNLVIGNKLGLKFTDFIVFNGPLIIFIMPAASYLLYLRFKDKVSGKVEIDIEKMKRENPIIDERQFFYTSVVFSIITLGLFTSGIHGVRPAWFCVMGFFLMAMVNSHHSIKPYLNAVEWDTLLFFANLFIFVECLAELGLIKAIGTLLADIIRGVPLDSRLEVAIILVLWVSTIGSAFLESLPYTTTMTYILADLRNSNDMGIPIEPLCWSLSVGACVGGIGSIMGSSANLVSMAVSERYSPENPIKGRDFLKFGFPTLLIITCFSTVYQIIVFAVIKPYTI